MHVEIQVALNFLISFLYNKLPRRRVNQFGEELENALKLKFEGHWYPEKPYKGSAFRCLKTTPPLDPVFEVAARESGMDIIDIQENLPQELSIWIDPGEVSYRMSEKGPVKILYSESDRPHDMENPDREVIRTFNPEAQCFKPIEATSMGFGSLSLAPSSSSPPSLHVIPNGFPSSPAPTASPSGPTSVPVAAAAVIATVVNGNGSNNSGGNSPNNGGGNLIAPGQPIAPSPIYKSFTTGSMGPSGFLPKSSTSNVTFTTATFAQTKFGSTKLKSNTKRSHRMSPTEFSNYIKQRALQQQQASVVSPNGTDRVNGDRLPSGMVNGMHSPSNLTYVHGSPNGTGLSSGNISPQNSRSMSPIGVPGGNTLDSVSNLLFMGNHSVCTTATSPITHSTHSSYYSGNGNLVGNSSMGHGSISPRHHPSHHSNTHHHQSPSHHSGLSSGLNGLYGSSSTIDSQLADLLGSSSLLPKSTPSSINNNGNTSPISSSSSNNNNVFNRFASLFDKNPVGSTSPNPYLSSSSVNTSANINSNIITSIASNSNASNNLINMMNSSNNLHSILGGDTSPLSSRAYSSNTILGLYGNTGHQQASTNDLISNGLGSNVISSSTVSIVDSISSSPSVSPSSITSASSLAATSPIIAVPSSSSSSSSSPASSSPSSSSSSVPSSSSPVPVSTTSASNSSVSSSSTAPSSSATSNKGFDNFSFSLNGVSYPNQYQHLLVAN